MISDRIKFLRERSRLTQTELGRKLGLTRSGIHSWETGISCPSAQGLIQLSKLFNVTVDFILEIENSETVNIADLNDKEKQLVHDMVEYMKSNR